MDKLDLCRVDFRLIHGQVMTRWAKKFGTECIIVIDDKSFKSALLKKILIGMAPTGVEVLVESVESASQKWKEELFPDKRTIVLFKNISTALSAKEQGFNYQSLQIGGIEGSSEKRNVYKSVVLSEEEVDELKKLNDLGVEVYLQPIPDDSCFTFKEVLAKF